MHFNNYILEHIRGDMWWWGGGVITLILNKEAGSLAIYMDCRGGLTEFCCFQHISPPPPPPPPPPTPPLPSAPNVFFFPNCSPPPPPLNYINDDRSLRKRLMLMKWLKQRKIFEISISESRVYKRWQTLAIIREVSGSKLETGRFGSKSGVFRIIRES